MRSKGFNDVFDKLATAEDEFLKSEFLAPAVRGGIVRVRIAGVVCTLRIASSFGGWGVFRPTSLAAAQCVRTATLAERRRYLELFPVVRLVLARKEDEQWLALAAHQGDHRFHIEGLVPIWLVEEVQQFQIVRTRFDGGNFWFEGVDNSRDPATAAYLRESLREMIDPNALTRSGLTPEEKAAYAANYFLNEESLKASEQEGVERRLREALEHAGAELIDYLEREDSIRVTYQVDGRTHVSAVQTSDLSVQSAGICLSGQDERFDLTSLVGVLREGGG